MNRPTDTHSAQGHPVPTPRVLHVVDLPGAGWDALWAVRRCALEGPASQRLLLIGNREAARDAASLGLEPDYRLCPTLGTLTTAVGPFDRLLSQINRDWPVDVVHVWSDSARVLCRETIGFGTPIVQEEAWRYSFSRPDRNERAALRAALGVCEDELCLLLAADRPAVGDARRFAGLVGVLHHAEVPSVGLASTACDHGRRAARFLRGFKREWDVLTCPVPPVRLIAAADILVYDQGDTLTDSAGPGRPSGGIVLAAALAGVPSVTTPSSQARTLLGPMADLIAPGGLMPELALPVWPLALDPAKRAHTADQLADHARTLMGRMDHLTARWQQACQTAATEARQ